MVCDSWVSVHRFSLRVGCFDFVILVVLWVLCFDFDRCDLICDLVGFGVFVVI